MEGIITAVIVLLCIMCFCQIMLLKKKKRIEMQNADNNSKITMANQLYDDVYRQNIQMRYLKHDMREFVENHEQYSQCSSTEELLRAIFMSKKEIAVKSGVSFDIENPIWNTKSGVAGIFGEWEKEDIISLINNIMNNAIEAAGKCTEGSVSVQIELLTDENSLMHKRPEADKFESKLSNIHIGDSIASSVCDMHGYKNESNKSDKKQVNKTLVMTTTNTMRAGFSAMQNDFKTDKENSKEHGYGTKIIMDILDRYHGTIEIKESDGKFVSRVSVGNG